MSIGLNELSTWLQEVKSTSIEGQDHLLCTSNSFDTAPSHALLGVARGVREAGSPARWGRSPYFARRARVPAAGPSDWISIFSLASIARVIALACAAWLVWGAAACRAPLVSDRASTLRRFVGLARSAARSVRALFLVCVRGRALGGGPRVRSAGVAETKEPFDFVSFASVDRKSTRLNSSHSGEYRMPSSA